MNPDAKVQIRGVQVGKVASIEQLPNGEAALHLAMDPKRLNAIPANVLVDIASTTVFGAKYVQFVSPPDPSPDSLRAGQVLNAQHVMVEINTVFEEPHVGAVEDRSRRSSTRPSAPSPRR